MHTHTHTHLSTCSDIAVSYPRTKHHTTTVPQFCVTEGPQFYSSEWWNFLTGTVLCDKTIMPIISWEGTMTLLQFCVEELQHYCCVWQNYHSSVCVCGKYHSATALWWNYRTVTVPGNYYIATILSRELQHCYSSVCWNKISTILYNGPSTLLQFCVEELWHYCCAR
jgi:hypothetical protein